MLDLNSKNYFYTFLKFFGMLMILHLVLKQEIFFEISEAMSRQVVLICGLILIVLYAVQELYKDFISTKGATESSEFSNSIKLSFKPLTTTELEVIAVHEIGHVMLFFALGDKPEKMYVQIHDQRIDTSNKGYVHYSFKERELNRITFKDIYVFMLIYLSGMQAEKFYFNEQRLFGSSTDMERWLHYAKLYLIHDDSDIYYDVPQNQYELNYNAKRLSDLKQKQIQILSEFFNTNRVVLKELVDKLIENKRLEYSAIVCYTNRITSNSEIERLSTTSYMKTEN